MTKRVKFSYRANNRSILIGVVPVCLDFVVDEEYAVILFESSL